MPVDTLPSGHTGGQEEGTVAMPRDEREDWIGPDQGLIRGLRSIAEVHAGGHAGGHAEHR